MLKRNVSNAMRILMVAVAYVMAMSVAAFAAVPGMNWDTSTITVRGEGVAPPNAINPAQGRMLARRAAVVDAYRQLAETVKGVQVESGSTVGMYMTMDDTTSTKISAVIQGARVVGEDRTMDGGYWVEMQVPVFGISNSLAAAVLPQPPYKESFPEPNPSVEPSQANMNVNITVNQGMSYGSPANRAIGGYTGLIVDCRGLGLNPAMSPVIKNADGTKIYGHLNLDYDRVVAQGMAGYAYDLSSASAARAGHNPLVVKAVGLDNHNSNPVVSVADANRILIENKATGFLDQCAVVFLR